MDFRSLSKIELHNHIDCALRPSTVFEIAKELKLDLPLHDFDEFKRATLITNPMTDLRTVLNKFLVTQQVLHSTEVIERMAFEASEDAHEQGVKLIEFRYSPSFIRSGHENLNFADIHSAIIKGFEKAKQKFGIEIGLIGIIGRNDPLALAEEVLEFILSRKSDFVAIDLADNEQDFDCKPFAPLFQKARSEGLHITVHAGEAIYDGSSQAVVDAIELLGAERIGHGIQIINDKDVMKLVRERNIHLEICPSSNYLTQSVRSIAEHPIKQLLDYGISLSINTDDPGIFDLTLSGEYELLSQNLGFTESDFKRCNQYALEASFLKTNLSL